MALNSPVAFFDASGNVVSTRDIELTRIMVNLSEYLTSNPEGIVVALNRFTEQVRGLMGFMFIGPEEDFVRIPFRDLRCLIR